MKTSKHLKKSFWIALFALLAALLAASSATFAWYIYNIEVHTTRVHMAAGTSASLYISSSIDGDYSGVAVLDEFTGSLNPVSTNRIQNGFQQAVSFVEGNEGQAPFVADKFSAVSASNYYKTSLYLKTDGETLNLYLSRIGFEDGDEENPISTAVRLGFVIPQTEQEFIFSINENSNPKAEYNTAQGQKGCVLDSTKTDGTAIEFTPYDASNFAEYDSSNAVVTLKDSSTVLCSVGADPVELDVYIWLEGCDEDCTLNLCATTLKNLALSFCAVSGAAA